MVIARRLSTPINFSQLSDNSLIVSQYNVCIILIQPNGDRIELGEKFNRPRVGIKVISPDIIALIDIDAEIM